MSIADRAFIKIVGKLILTVVMGLVSFFVLLLLFGSVLIGGLFMIIFATIMLLVFLPAKLQNMQITISRIILGVAAIVMIIMFSDLPIREAQKRFDGLDVKVIKSGPKSLTLKDKLTVYNANLIISIYGRFLGFPEYAKQSFGLTSKTKAPRSRKSDFALKSPKIVGVVNNWIFLLKKHRRDVAFVMLPARTVSWQTTQGDRRVALALNPVKMEAKGCPVGNRWRLDCKATTRMKYRRGARRVLLLAGNKKFTLPESPFWALQEEGWLKPYTAIWEWSIFSDDERLK